MSEKSAIQRSPKPRTRESLMRDFHALGVEPGMTLMVHTSLSSLGWVCGGPVTVVQALMDVVMDEGTIVMPSHSADLSDPADWGDPPVPESWWPTIRRTMPAYEPLLTPTRGMGKVAEIFCKWPGVSRSAHPHASFAAWGRNVERITSTHLPDDSLGEASPLARIYELGGHVLLLGVGHESNTSFHLSEYRAYGVERKASAAPMIENGERVWRTFEDIDFHEELFPQIGADLDATGLVTVGKVGSAETRLLPQREAVDFAAGWLRRRSKDI